MCGSDADSLRAVRLRALGDAPAAFASTRAVEAELPESHWRELAAVSELAGDAVVFLALRRGHGVGMAAGRWFDRDQKIAHLWGMWVDPELRRHGLGQRLVDEVNHWAASRGARSLRLGTIEGAGGATEFYERLGFVPTGESKPLVRDETLTAFFLARPV